MNIQILRQRTEEEHCGAEGALPLMRPDLDSTTYVEFLGKWYGVIAAWEEQASLSAPMWLQPRLMTGSRRSLLTLDLAWFGVMEPQKRVTLPRIGDVPSVLGAM